MTTIFYRLTVRLGEYDTASKIDCSEGVCSDKVVRINVTEIFAHPDYVDKQNDIAVLKLEKDAPYTGKNRLHLLLVVGNGPQFHVYLRSIIFRCENWVGRDTI